MSNKRPSRGWKRPEKIWGRRLSDTQDLLQTCERKRSQLSSNQTTKHIEWHLRIRNGPRSPTIVRMHEIVIGFVGVTPIQTRLEHDYSEQKRLTSALTERIRRECGWRRLNRFSQYPFVRSSPVVKDDKNIFANDLDVGNAFSLYWSECQYQREVGIFTHQRFPI